MSEYAFELALCAHLEATRPGLVSRQLGCAIAAPGNRVMDVVHVAPGPDFDVRRRLSADAIPPKAIESEAGPGQARRWRRCFPDAHPEAANRTIDRAVEAGFFEREKRGGRTYVRQVARYPDWFGALLGVENKPDLGAPGDLETQLRKDVSLGLLDRVVLATASYVTGAHLNRLPDAVGVWRFDPDRAGDPDALEVVREPAALSPGTTGLEVVDTTPARVDVAPVDAGRKAEKRRAVAERAWGKGWRPRGYPGCQHAGTVGAAESEALPHCAHFETVVDPGECGQSCPAYAAGPPPTVDAAAERAALTDWDPDPPGLVREQASLGRFGGGVADDDDGSPPPHEGDPTTVAADRHGSAMPNRQD